MKNIFKILSLLFLIVSTATALAQQVTYDWQYKFFSTQYTYVSSVALDTAGYVYAGGTLDDSLTFIDTTVHNTQPTAFLAKLTNDGNLVWFKQFSTGLRIYSINFDSENKLYFAGFYYNQVAINDTLIQTPNADKTSKFMFFAKFDTDGNLIWAKQTAAMYLYEAPYNLALKLMTIDKDDNIILAGECVDEIEYFDTSATYNSIDSSWVTTPYPHWEYYQGSTGFIAKYNKDGQKLWVKNTGPYAPTYYSLKTDYSGNILLTGSFGDSYDVVFDSIVISPTAIDNIFIAKYNPNGHIIWAQKAGGGSNGNYGYDIISDSLNNIYMTGTATGGVDFGGSDYFWSYSDAFLTKYDSSGIVKWAIPIGSSHDTVHVSDNAGTCLYIKNGEIYLTGYFLDVIDLGFTTLNCNGNKSAFILKYDFIGNILNAAMDDEQQYFYPTDLDMDENNNFLLSCYLKMPYGALIGKIPNSYLVNVQTFKRKDFTYSIFPNPCIDKLFISTSESSEMKVEIIDITGRTVKTGSVDFGLNELDIAGLNNGIYIIRLLNNQINSSQKIIKN